LIRTARADVTEVVDGDTLHSLLDIGWGVVLRPRKGVAAERGLGSVRCVYPDGSAYDAPEKKTAHGKEATAYARTLIAPGDRLEVVSYGVEDLGRTLGAVTLRDGRDWATTMAAAGYVK
jgi:endonuclease YncB( thermonuclease family)